MSAPAADAPFRHLRIAAVVDDFTRASLAPEVRLLNLDATWWPVQLARFRPDLLFVESAWRGHEGGWSGKIAAYPDRRRSVRFAALRAAARAARIPTAFWNKEDPVHYDRFVESARGFDHVFTTAVEQLDHYRRDLGLSRMRVGVLPFAVQPRIYSPGESKRDDRVVFAGSYGEPHFPERRRQLEMLLDGALAARAQLQIFDRTAREPNPDKAFPRRFQRYIAGSRDYRALANEYRSARVGLNVNSVTNSETMLSRRVFEMLACGLQVVSGPSKAIAALLPGLVTIVQTSREAAEAIEAVEADTDAAAETVLQEHTIAARLSEVFAQIGIA